MGMPNAYKCNECDDVYFDGTPAGQLALRNHYNAQRHGSPVPNTPNAYKCHICNAPQDDPFHPNERPMIEHYRTKH